MAQPTTMNGSKLLIELGDGGGPEVFAAPCGLTTKGFTISGETNDFEVPDCDTPDAAVWIERVVRALSVNITGEGILAMESWDEWRLWAESAAAKNIRVKLDTTGALNGGYYSMSAVLNSLEVSGELKGKLQVSVAISSNGAATWTAAA